MAGNAQRLELRQGQHLVMTPQLQQSLKMLQYSNQELLEYIEAEIEKNPLLEKEDAIVDSQSAEAAEFEDSIDTVDRLDISERELTQSVEGDSLSEKESLLDVGDKDSWDSNGNLAEEEAFKSPAEEANSLRINTSLSDSYRYNDGESLIDQAASGKPSLREHLENQILVDFDDNQQKIIASYMIDELEPSGYFTADLINVARTLECDVRDVKQVLGRLQKLDPSGIFARNLQECLAIQLKDLNHYDPAMEKLVSHLDLLAKGELKKLRKICNVDEEDFKEMVCEIKQLNPRPASSFSDEITQTAQIDIFLRKNNNGVWAIELNNEVLPKVLVNNKYYSEVKKFTKKDEDKEFLAEQYNSANWLIKSLNQRAETILKVATELVSKQNDFFEKGIYHLKPMVLADIANAIGMHESTVGRVTTNKYISTPRGVFELKYFFSSSVGSSVGSEDHSSKTVKHIIKELVESESDFKSVHSDDKIAEILKSRGVDVARRTVAKYRESMHIPTSSERKRKMKMLAGMS